MAQPVTLTKSKDHRGRKNSGAAEHFKKLRHEKNTKRPKQRFDEFKGFWTREPIGTEEA